jgi:predicted TIM-barrel fold metal-dependent hydrolase
VPPFYAQALASHGGDPSGSVTPGWSPESALDFMDSQQIATGILSVSTPSVVGWAQGERREMARRINDYTADLVAGRPDRSRTGVQLVLNGILDRYPRVRIILSHAGGFLPYASLRFAELARVFQPDVPSPDAILASMRRFYFDTALSSGPALPTLKAFAGPGHILFGTDSPYDHGVSAAFTAALDADDSLTADNQAAISHRNAQALFPRLAPNPQPPRTAS